jgi:hypothetical protein
LRYLDKENLAREREKMMLIPPMTPPSSMYDKAEVESKEQELRRDFNAGLPVGYLIVSIAIVLFLIIIVVMSGFHLL